MKLLFIGEGRHDIGDSNADPSPPRSAQGTIPTLARRICPNIASESVALAWREIRRFNPSAQKHGYPAKIAAAVLLAARKFGCAGTVVVADRDGQAGRQSEMAEGVERARQLFPTHRAVWGLAFESIEAWTLGVPEKIAEELGVDLNLVQQQYPRGVNVESLSERSGKVDHRPKQLLERIAHLNHRQDSTDFRQAIAEKTDVATLAQVCPQGFAPFAEQMRNALARPVCLVPRPTLQPARPND
ncbi:MAG: hypothetical protein ACYC3I_05700 [Gemmataceae bacterium]